MVVAPVRRQPGCPRARGGIAPGGWRQTAVLICTKGPGPILVLSQQKSWPIPEFVAFEWLCGGPPTARRETRALQIAPRRDGAAALWVRLARGRADHVRVPVFMQASG